MLFYFLCKSSGYLFCKFSRLKFLTLLCFLLLPGIYSYAGHSELKISPGWIEGSAKSVPLGQLLAQYANETGCSVYLDETLNDSPATFSISQKLSHEKGIRKMVSPHSYSIVFSGKPSDETANILEIHVFKKGQRTNAKFRAIHNTGYSPGNSHTSGTVYTQSYSGSSSNVPSDAGRAINAKKMFRQSRLVEKSAYGTPVLKNSSGERGPDYRMSALEMKKAHEDYRQAKYDTELRSSQVTGRQAKKDFYQNKRQYQETRNQKLKKYISQQLDN